MEFIVRCIRDRQAVLKDRPRLLEDLGNKYPEAMTPDGFEAVLLREPANLGPKQRAELLRFGLVV